MFFDIDNIVNSFIGVHSGKGDAIFKREENLTMEDERSGREQTSHKELTVPDRIVVIHVIDRDFLGRCIRHSLGTEEDIKKTLFLDAKTRLQNLLRKEGMDDAEKLICEGTPFLEINNQAIQCGADMIVMGTLGNSGDMKNIFFGSTTEWVLRFIKRPVLCVPLDENHSLK